MKRFFVVALLLGCSSPEQGRVLLDKPNGDPQVFGQVEEALGPTCATLDCHGQVGRNFRFYWSRGLRLGDQKPGEGDTTVDEYRATYESMVALEPYIMDQVVNGKAKPEALTLVRKARGAEGHKGGAMIAVGSDADLCLISWLRGAIDRDACKRAVPTSP